MLNNNRMISIEGTLLGTPCTGCAEKSTPLEIKLLLEFERIAPC
jgi:hypothetical protein